jgi:hypothetical protein
MAFSSRYIQACQLFNILQILRINNFYGLELAITSEDYKAMSMNAMHSSIQITDQFYSNITDEEIKRRIQAFDNKKPLTA